MELRTPGVRIHAVEVPRPAPFRMSIAGFVGRARAGEATEVAEPRALSNWGQFRDEFGSFRGASYLAYAVFGFFANGGERCWVVAVEDGEEMAGLAALETVPEVGTVVMPDLVVPDLERLVPATEVPEEGIVFARPPAAATVADYTALAAGQRALLTHCARMGERFAVLDPPPGASPASEPRPGEPLPVRAWAEDLRALPEAHYGALYYPWIRQRPGDFGGRELWLPPCGHLAGIYARSEAGSGVGKVPANELLRGVVDLAVCLDDEEQAELNPAAVNALRVFPGRGLRVWGGRTLSPDPSHLYVSFRRVTLSIIKRILTGLQWTVFEPNSTALWTEIRTALTLLMQGLFTGGALAGATPEEAFFVQCDEETNPPERVDRGEVLARVGFAPARPAEFIVVTIRRTGDSLEARESAAPAGAGF